GRTGPRPGRAGPTRRGGPDGASGATGAPGPAVARSAARAWRLGAARRRRRAPELEPGTVGRSIARPGLCPRPQGQAGPAHALAPTPRQAHRWRSQGPRLAVRRARRPQRAAAAPGPAPEAAQAP